MKTMYREIGWLSAEDVEDVGYGQLRTSVMAMAYEAQSMAVPMDPKPRKGKTTIIEIENHFQEYKRRFFVVFNKQDYQYYVYEEIPAQVFQNLFEVEQHRFTNDSGDWLVFKALDYLYSGRVVKVSPGKEVFRYDSNGSTEKVKDIETIWNYLLYVPEQIEAILRRG